MLNLDINYLIIVLESCTLEFCGASLKNLIDIALSKVGTFKRHSFQSFKKPNKLFFHKVHLTKVEAKVEAQLSLKYRPLLSMTFCATNWSGGIKLKTNADCQMSNKKIYPKSQILKDYCKHE